MAEEYKSDSAHPDAQQASSRPTSVQTSSSLTNNGGGGGRGGSDRTVQMVPPQMNAHAVPGIGTPSPGNLSSDLGSSRATSPRRRASLTTQPEKVVITSVNGMWPATIFVKVYMTSAVQSSRPSAAPHL